MAAEEVKVDIVEESTTDSSAAAMGTSESRGEAAGTHGGGAAADEGADAPVARAPEAWPADLVLLEGTGWRLLADTWRRAGLDAEGGGVEGIAVEVRLTPVALLVKREGDGGRFLLAGSVDDMLGAQDLQHGHMAPGNAANVHIAAAPGAAGGGGCFGGAARRRPADILLRAPSSDEARRWEVAINTLVRGRPFVPADIGLADSLAGGRPLRRRLLVVINPVGGSGSALKLWRDKGEQVLARGNNELRVVVTTHQFHGTELAAEVDLEAVDGIVVVGGDGMLSEVVKGLFSRRDWRDAVKMPLGILPGGSGNGLATSLLAASGEGYSFDGAAFHVARGRCVPAQLSWAMIADIDVESERWRCCGGLRFDVGGVVRAVGLRKYRGRFSWLPASELADAADGAAHDGGDGGGEGDEGDMVDEGADAAGDGEEKEADGALDAAEEDDAPDGLPQRLLPEPGAPLPDGWQTIEGTFTFLMVASVSHAAYNMIMAGDAGVGGDLLHVSLVQDVGRITMTKLLLSLEDGSWQDMPCVRQFTARAYRLEPLSGDGVGHVALDGEQVAYGATQGEVHPGVLNLMCPAYVASERASVE